MPSEHTQLQATLTASNTCARYERESPGRDMWQTPAELARSGVGDCEDFAIDAMFRVIQAGLEGEVSLGCFTRGSNVTELHMVCLYFPQHETDPWVLDVVADDVCRLSERPDLKEVYRLDRHSIFVEGRRVGDAADVAPWAAVLARMADE